MADFIELKAQYEEAYKLYKKEFLKERSIDILDGLDDLLPLELLENRAIIEGNVLGCLFANNELFHDNKDVLQEKSFITMEGRVFFRLGQEITKQGIKEIDEISIKTYLSGKETLSEVFEDYGGYSTIKDLKKINEENFEAYLDTLQKYNIMNQLHFKGFNILDDFKKFKEMNSNELYDWYDYMVNNTFLKVNDGLKPIDLTQGNRDFLKRANEGLDKGVEIKYPIMNYRLAGLHRGNILLHTAHSGVGKTSSIIPMYVLPLIEQGLKVVLLINEQSGDAWRSMLLPSIVNSGYIGKEHTWIQRNKFTIGGFSDAELSDLEKASDWLEKYESNLILYPLEDYSVRTVKKIVKKFMRIDEETTFILDTWKSSKEDESNAHAIFTEESKEMFKFIKSKDMGGLNVRFIASAQLAGSTINQRFLNVSALAKAKAIKEVCGQILMMRYCRADELAPKSKFYINPYKFNKTTGEREDLILNPDKKYVIMFYDKNRYGKSDFQTIFEINLDFNSWREIGYCTVANDN